MKKSICFFLVLLCAMLIGCQRASTVSAVSYADVGQINADALQAFDGGDYVDALMKYSDAMKSNPIDMDARIGAIKCQIALGNYEVADMNLSAAMNLDSQVPEIYDMYIALSRESGQMDYAFTAIGLAKENDIESFLSKIPDPPVFSCPEGDYDAPIQVEVTAEAGAEIFISEEKNPYVSSYQYDEPIPITRGYTNLEAYCVKDGIPSDSAAAYYMSDYPPIEISFVDPIIEMLVRLSLGNESGPVTDVDCENISSLYQSDLLYSDKLSWREYENAKITSLQDLQYLTGLQSLTLRNSDHNLDCSPLSACKSLYSVDIANCAITDISFAQDIPYLEYLSIRDNQVSDLSPLANCKSLFYLDISGNPVTDLSVLSETDIAYLGLTLTSDETLSTLCNVTSLTQLFVSDCGGYDLSPLAALAQLMYLDMDACDYYADDGAPLGDLSFLSSLKSLTYLSMWGMSDYSGLAHVKSLKNLTDLRIMTLDRKRVPADVLEDLQAALPGCSIYNG